ncbi:hypothetical protein HRbin01_01782 [archaeon HR01]|nr:hypothetical protein HRbin01_01782 [archaeon HR01]
MDEMKDDIGGQPVKMSDEDLLLLVRHHVRRRILVTVGSEGKINASILRQRLGISTGSLYYNLRQLTPLIAQDQKRVYYLTEEGKRIYRILTEQAQDLTSQRSEGVISRIGNAIFPIWLFAPLYESRVVAATLGFLSLFVLLFVLVAGRHSIFLLNISPVTRVSISDLATQMALTIVVSSAFLSAISLIMSGRIKSITAHLKQLKSSGLLNFAKEQLKFTASIIVAFLPLGLLPGIAMVERVLNLGFIGSGDILARDAVLVLSQTIAVIMLGAAVSYVKKMRWQAGLAAALAYFYLSHGLSLFLR